MSITKSKNIELLHKICLFTTDFDLMWSLGIKWKKNTSKVKIRNEKE